MSLMGPAARWMDEIPESSHLIQKKLSFLKRPLARIDRATEEIEAFGSRPNQAKHGVTVEVNDQKLSSTVVAMTGNIVVGGLLTIALLYFLLTVGPDLAAKVGQITESHTSRWKIFEILHEAERSVSTYLLTYAVINTVLGAVITFGLWLVGLPNPALWGVMAGFLNFIPYAGATLGVVIVGFVGLLSFDSPSYALLAPAVYAFCNTLEGQFITPAILGRWMNLSPLWILLSLTFWGWLWGVGGAFIAVPLLAVTKIVCDRVPQLRPWGIILGK